MAEAEKFRLALVPRKGSAWLPAIAFVLLGALALALWGGLANLERDSFEERVRAEAAFLASRIDADMRSRLPSLRRIADRWIVRGGIPKGEFLADAHAHIADMPGFQAIEWADPGLVVRWVVPLEGNEPALGLDLGREPRRLSTLDKARSLRSAEVTAPIDLVQGGKGFLVCFPIYAGDRFMGFIVAVFRAREWLDYVLGAGDGRIGVDFEVSVAFDDATVFETEGWKSPARGLPSAAARASVFDGRMRVEVRPAPSFAARSRSPLPAVVAAGCLVLAALVGFVVRLGLEAGAEAKAANAARKELEAEVAARRRTEEELGRREKQVRLLLDSTAEAIYGIDLEGNCVFVNRACLRMLGYASEGDLLGRNMHELIHHSFPDGSPMPQEECRIFRAFRESVGVHCDDEVLWRSVGTSFPAEYWSYPQIEAGRTIGAVVAFVDITERKSAEAALAAASRNLEEQLAARTRSLTEAHDRLMEQRLLQNDLQMAGQFQAELLPPAPPAIEGFDFACRALPSRFVNGDFYDFELRGSGCFVLLADIAGKGLPAALLASSARALYRRLLGELDDADPGAAPASPAAILRELNRELFPDLERVERFITMIAARLDLESGALEVANAGGCRAIVFDGTGASSRALEGGGLPIGVFADSGAMAQGVGLRPGTGVILYSDGITEAANPRGELFGMERLLAEAASAARLDAEGLVSRILSSVEAFREGAPSADDTTILALKARPRRTRFTFASTLESIDGVPMRVARLCASYGEAVAGALELAVSEILTNLREHGYAGGEGPVDLELRLETRGVEVMIRERGEPFDLASLPPPELGAVREGGLGLHLVRATMDQMVYEPGGSDGNLWILFKSAEAR